MKNLTTTLCKQDSHIPALGHRCRVRSDNPHLHIAAIRFFSHCCIIIISGLSWNLFQCSSNVFECCCALSMDLQQSFKAPICFNEIHNGKKVSQPQIQEIYQRKKMIDGASCCSKRVQVAYCLAKLPLSSFVRFTDGILVVVVIFLGRSSFKNWML